VVCGIAQLGLDHPAFLGDRLEQIAMEKAGIAKPGVNLVTLHYPDLIGERVGEAASAAGAHLAAARWRLGRERAWRPHPLSRPLGGDRPANAASAGHPPGNERRPRDGDAAPSG
jgi:folylpolyglutamate synthase/dihydropteroate synthase